MICGVLKYSFNISFLVISHAFYKITSSSNFVYINLAPTYFISIKSKIYISCIDLLRDCRPPRTCKIDLGKTGNHFYRRDRKNVTLLLVNPQSTNIKKIMYQMMLSIIV